MKVCQARTFVD